MFSKKRILSTVSLLCLGLLMAGGAQAAEFKLNKVDQRQFRSSKSSRSHSFKVDRTGSTESRRRAKVVHLSGELRYSHRNGLTLNGVPVTLEGNTSMAFSKDGRLPNPRSLNGRQVTIFGTQTSTGVRASLVIQRPQNGIGTRYAPDPLTPYMVPSDSDRSVGEITDGAPE